MSFVFKLHGNTYAVNDRTSGVLPSAVTKLNWAIPTPLILRGVLSAAADTALNYSCVRNTENRKVELHNLSIF